MHGTIGLIATNTIGQGDTRVTGLQRLIAGGYTIYDATRSLLWPGAAKVAVSVVHLAKGSASAVVRLAPRSLDGRKCEVINSRLRPRIERDDPAVLRANAEKAFTGTYVYGEGFVLQPTDRDELTKRDRRNAERIFPYLGGKEVNTSPTQTFQRYVINFGDMELQEAARWPDLLSIVREKVKPDRDKNKREVRRKYWWRFGETTPALHAALQQRKHCLVTGIISKHLMFSFQPVGRIFSHKLYVFPFDTCAHFALVQSRVHTAWAWLLSSTMKNDLNYSASDCFETFPFPPASAFDKKGKLEAIGERLLQARSEWMAENKQGLTKVYNHLRDEDISDPGIEVLRRLHVEMDRAVLAAYGWQDIAVPPFSEPVTDADWKARDAFEDEVIDRLFALNAERAAEERVLGSGASSGTGAPTRRSSTVGKGKAPSGQLGLSAATSRKKR